MLGFDALDKLFNKPSLVIDQAQCLNNRHAGAGCTACMEACPSGVLSFQGVAARAVTGASQGEGAEPDPSDDGLQVDPEGCLGCGVCVGACPTSALQATLPDPNTLLTKVKGKPAVILACPKSEVEGALQVPCLAALDADLLLLMGLMGVREIALDDRPCQGCEFKGADLVRRLPSEAKPLAKAFAIEMGVRLVSNGKPLPKVSSAEGSGEAIGRRELFTLWRRSAGEMASVLTEDLVFLNNARPRGLKHRVSAKRVKLLEVLRQRDGAKDDTAREAWAEAVLPAGRVVGAPLRIQADACDACGLCAAICPTGAIGQTRGDDGRIALSEVVPHCLDCGLCLNTCPHRAILREEQITAAEWLSPTPRVLVEVQSNLCSHCGKAFTPSPLAPQAGGLCLQCSTEKDLLNELFGS